MTAWEFFDKHYILAFILAFFTLCACSSCFKLVLRLPVLIIHGWPSKDRYPDGVRHRMMDEPQQEGIRR